jgi:hypothetical protein
MYLKLWYSAQSNLEGSVSDPSRFADSGGPGTYSQLLILKDYMSRLSNDLDVREDSLYPADYFDLMGGVGFGGCAYFPDKLIMY